MKCICGYEEPKEWIEQVEVLFKSGPRKGQFNRFDEIVHRVDNKDKFIKLGVEKGFSFVREESPTYHWDESYTLHAELYVCPKCHTVKMVI